MLKRIFALMLVAIVALAAGCSSEPKEQIPNPTVTITMESGDTIQLELYPNVAPNTVANFINLAQAGFYDGLIFHRVIAGFMIQGGCPDGTGTGGPGYRIKGEFKANGFENGIKHERGVISMARSAEFDSAGSQFFIMHADAGHLDGQYAAFGKVIDSDSLTTIDKIAATPTDSMDKPLIEQRIASITVDTKGYEYTVVKK